MTLVTGNRLVATALRDHGVDTIFHIAGAPNIDLSFALADAGIIDAPVVGDGNPFDGRSDRITDLSVVNLSVFGQ
ncbi:MAG: hypothetical protein JRF61_09880, partial [Deltaproteobacteria bacterium]|nr:hypothetical protein [Deltaproteobacteria bacterium]